MRRIYPAYPDLLPVTHAVRPGYLPADRVLLDPIRMAVVWKDAPQRVLPNSASVPRNPVRAIAFARVVRQRPEVLERLISRGSTVLLVLDDPELKPADLGLGVGEKVFPILPILPSPLGESLKIPETWQEFSWGAFLGLFPFPEAMGELEEMVQELEKAGAHFVLTAPLLLTPQDRHRILEIHDGAPARDELENSLFHADISRGFHHLERRAGVLLDAAGIDNFLGGMAPRGCDAAAVKTAAMLRLWARRLDQSRRESSRGWRLRRAAAALEPLRNDPRVLAREGNLRVIPGFDRWVEEFTRSLWEGGGPVEDAWKLWKGEA